MKKYIITAVSFAACLALCATVWPQSEASKEIPAPSQVTAVSAPESTVDGIADEAEIMPPTEEEKIEIPRDEPIHEDISELELEPEEMPVVAEVQSAPEPEQESAPVPIPTPVSAPSQTVTDSQPGDMVYVPGFGWVECQGPGEVIYDEDIYENGNKIGVMG